MPTPAPDDFRFDDTPRGPRAKYQWAKYADGKVWTFTRGEDFTITAKSLRAQAHNYALKHGLMARTATLNDGNTVMVQFDQRPKEQA